MRSARPEHDRQQDRPAPLPQDTPTATADAPGPPRRFLRGLSTFESFGHRDYSYFFVGAALSNTGTWMQQVALGWLVYELTRSSSALGVVNFLNGIPVTFLIIFAGALADRVDRRKLLIWSQVILMAQALAFGVLTQMGVISIPWIYSLTLAAGTVSAFMFPAWQAMVPDLVPRESLLNAIALSSAQFNAARLVGPMLGGAVLAAFGIAEVFYANALSFLFVIWALWVIRPNQEMHGGHHEESRTGALVAGLRYARQHRRVAMHLVTATMLTILGMPFIALLPIIAAETLGLGSTGYSVLMGANGAGALVGALAVASLPKHVHRDNIIRYGLALQAVGVVVLSFVRTGWIAAAVLVVMGAAFLACVSSINTNLQTAAPPRIRGRVMSLFVLSFMGIMPLGSLVFGALGEAIGAPRALLAGGVGLLAFAAVLIANPRLLCERASDDC